MSWIADLHIHSHFSMATSRDCNPQNLHQWAGLKGVSLVGTGDFTHPGWRKELRDTLTPAEPGLYRLTEPRPFAIPDHPDPRFVVSGEISTIYKKDGRTRKVHHLVILPSLEDADRISSRLETLGMNIRSDGRPILGMDSRHLLELILECCSEVIIIPAHIWTPHFSVFGSNSGFDAIEECYEDLTPNIFALETGLSSDPAMNWRWSALDRFALVSNSDAHNPQNLAREANIFEGEFSYNGMRKALQNKSSRDFGGTLEFFPEEGKYHYDGHRNCDVCWKPEETLRTSGVCPVCGRRVTVGVLHRVHELADRPEGYVPAEPKPFQCLIPLRQIIAAAVKSTVSSKKVDQIYTALLYKLGPELGILRYSPLEDIVKSSNSLVGEAVRRLRIGEVEIKPGFDGEYGVISVLREDDRQAVLGQAALLEDELLVTTTRTASNRGDIKGKNSDPKKIEKSRNEHEPLVFTLSDEQQKIVATDMSVALVIAGPGTGKTRTLVERIAHLIREKKAKPDEMTAVTFTNRAAAEIKKRLDDAVGDKAATGIAVGTFHSLAWKVLNQNPEPLGFSLIDSLQTREIVEESLRELRIPMTARDAALAISVQKNRFLRLEETGFPQSAVENQRAAEDQRTMELVRTYQNKMESYGYWDFDDIILQAVDLWEQNPDWLQPYKKHFRHLLIDEFQDLNAVQYQLIRLWSAESAGLMAIGDPNQAIYGFRGASSQFFERLRQDFPETTVFQLSQNHRSAEAIVTAANHLIAEEHRQNTSSGDNPTVSPVFRCVAPSERAAAKSLVREIVRLIGGSTMISAHDRKKNERRQPEDSSLSFNDIGVLYRTGRQVEPLEEALTDEGLPYRVSGQEPTLEATTVKEVLTFFRFLKSPGSLLLRTVLRFPYWEFNKAEIISLSALFHPDYLNWFSEPSAWPGEAKNLIPEEKQEGWTPEFDVKIGRLIDNIKHYQAFLDTPVQRAIVEWNQRGAVEEWDILERLERLAENYPTMSSFLDFLPLAAEADLIRRGNRTAGTETITLSTLHASKGLEYPVVFIFGVEEGVLPYAGSGASVNIEEEQRLFYVGMTRARRLLYLVNIQNRSRGGQIQAVEPSRFLKLLPVTGFTGLTWRQFAEKNKQLELF